MIHWLLELTMFEEQQLALREAALARGHRVSAWRDDWWDDNEFPCLREERVLFHGSLGNAARLALDPRWQPGAFCDVTAFRCSTWFARALPWLLNRDSLFTTVRAVVADPGLIFPGAQRLFFRPDSPLKEFSGRVLDRGEISAAALDHGFYYDDLDLPIIVSPAVEVGPETRCVIADRKVVAASSYEPQGRRAVSSVEEGAALDFARAVAAELEPPEPVYVLDICGTPAGYRVLELNPFSGADLYRCSPVAIAAAVESVLRR